MVSRVVQTTLLLVLIATFFAADAGRNRITVTKYKTNHRIDSWDDYRWNPYNVTLWKYGLKSVYTFDTSGNIRTLTARDTKYTFDDEVGSRMLVGTNDESVQDVDAATGSPRFSCTDCSATWHTLCDAGLADVCYLDDNPLDNFDQDAMDSVRRFCSAFGAACEMSAIDACDELCT